MPSRGGGKPSRRPALEREIEADALAKPRSKRKLEKRRDRTGDEEDYLPDALSTKILSEAKALREEDERAAASDDEGDDERSAVRRKSGEHRVKLGKTLDVRDRTLIDDSYGTDDEDEGGEEAEDGRRDAFYEDDDDDDEITEADGEYEDVEISPEEAAALEAFMEPKSGKERTLADMIMEKIQEQEQGGGRAERGDDGEVVPEGLDPRVVEIYRQVGDLLSRYTTGKVPKAFKVIPALSNWEEVLYLTNPERWSPHAMYAATRLFASNLNVPMAQRFYNLVLLPRVRQDIADNRRLHYALFMSLKKATFKPAAFFKGMLLPLCQSKTCTLREAVIFSAILSRCSVPALHSAAVLMKLSTYEYAGTTSFFMRVLIDKKYALPFSVVDALVDHFLRFSVEERELPVVWHQTLLTFVQRYKAVMDKESKKALNKLVGIKSHYLITPEIRRELAHGKSRGEENDMDADVPAAGVGAFSKSVRVKALDENMRDMPDVPMLADDQY